MSPARLETLSVERAADVVTISLERLTMAPQMFRELGGVFRALTEDGTHGAVVLRSAVQHFTYGLDRTAAFSEQGAEITDGIRAIAACPAPVLAVVHGRCMGSGIDLISACDIRVASVDAKFSGPTRALAGLGTDVSAARAQQLGLINDVYADRSALAAAAEALAREIAKNPALCPRTPRISDTFRDVASQRPGRAV